ncbi:ABC-2 family transporter protein [Neobacillus mesonae]|nr:ABC-2 family transporter protein [Neobacillus mesonae]
MKQNKLKAYFELYSLLIRTSIKSSMQYKFNFFLGAFLAALIQIAEFLMIAIVLNRFGAIQGWSIYEVGYLFAIMTLSKTVYRSFANEVHHLEKYLVSGDLDQLLTRPLPVLFTLLPQRFRIMLGEWLQGGFVFAWSIYGMMSSGQISWIAIPQSMFVILTGAVILFSIGLATATLGFWTTRISELQTFTEDAAGTAARYPLSLYPNWLAGLLLVVLPVGLVNYAPALYILRGEAGPWILAVILGAALLCLSLSLKFWSYGMTKYQSTGS